MEFNPLRVTVSDPTFNKVMQRFTDKVCVNIHGCWPWLGALDRYGKGRFYFEGKMVGAHRFILELYTGTLKSTERVRRHCSLRCCVNPEHLYRNVK